LTRVDRHCGRGPHIGDPHSPVSIDHATHWHLSACARSLWAGVGLPPPLSSAAPSPFPPTSVSRWAPPLHPVPSSHLKGASHYRCPPFSLVPIFPLPKARATLPLCPLVLLSELGHRKAAAAPDESWSVATAAPIGELCLQKNFLLFPGHVTFPPPSQRASGPLGLIDDYQRCPLLAVLKPNRLIRKHMDANCSIFHLSIFLGLSNPQG
jgi:hypothetical protein